MGKAIVNVNAAMLLSALRLPSQYKVLEIRGSLAFDGKVDLLIESDEFPQTREGVSLPTIDIVYRTKPCPCGKGEIVSASTVSEIYG